MGIKEGCLRYGARDPVEQEELLVWEITVSSDKPFNIVMPDTDRDVVGDQMPFRGVRMVDLACRGLRGEAAEDIAGGEVKMVASTAEEFTEGSFSSAGRSEDHDRSVLTC